MIFRPTHTTNISVSEVAIQSLSSWRSRLQFSARWATILSVRRFVSDLPGKRRGADRIKPLSIPPPPTRPQTHLSDFITPLDQARSPCSSRAAKVPQTRCCVAHWDTRKFKTSCSHFPGKNAEAILRTYELFVSANMHYTDGLGSTRSPYAGKSLWKGYGLVVRQTLE